MNSRDDYTQVRKSGELVACQGAFTENSNNRLIEGHDSKGRTYIKIEDYHNIKITKLTADENEASSSKDILIFVKTSVDNAKMIKNFLDKGSLIKHKFALVEAGKFKSLTKIINVFLIALGITKKGRIQKAIDKSLALERLSQLRVNLKIEHDEFKKIKEAIGCVSLKGTSNGRSTLNARESSIVHKQIEDFKSKVFNMITQDDANEFIQLVKKYDASEELKDIKYVLSYLIKESVSKAPHMIDYSFDSVSLIPESSQEDEPPPSFGFG